MSSRSLILLCLVVASFGPDTTTTTAQYAPARLKSGEAAAPPPNTVGWAWDVAVVSVDPHGRPGSYQGLFGTRGWAGFVWKAVINTWSFEPARDGGMPVETRVFVAGCYRPAALTTGPDSRPPRVTASQDAPSPTKMVPPAYPPRALGDGAVIVELRIDATGTVIDARVVQSAPGFDQAALDAAQEWRFQPAQRGGAAVPAYVYLIFGFRQPVS